LYYFHKKFKKFKKTQKKNIFNGFLCGFFGFLWAALFGWVFYCQPCLLLLQLHRVEDAEENLGNWEGEESARIMSKLYIQI
jgi:hypothetical protein